MRDFVELGDRIRQDLLGRLRWNVLAPLEEVTVVTGPLGQTINVPLFDHPYANEPIADPPLSCIDKMWIDGFRSLCKVIVTHSRIRGTLTRLTPAAT